MENVSETSAVSGDGSLRVFTSTSSRVDMVAKEGEAVCSSVPRSNPHSQTVDPSVLESVRSTSPGTGLLSTSQSPVPPHSGDVSMELVDYKEELQQLAAVYARAITGRKQFCWTVCDQQRCFPLQIVLFPTLPQSYTLSFSC